MSDVPSRSGLGSSSIFTANLIHSLKTLKNEKIDKYNICKDVIYLEQEILKESVGIQDSIAGVFGGLNIIKIKNTYDFDVIPIKLKEEEIKHLEKSLLLFYTGIARTSSEISSSYKNTIELHKQNVELAEECILAIYNKNFDKIGDLLNKNWKIKKKLSQLVTNNYIDEVYEKALLAGAIGGKICGSGGGGCLTVYIKEMYRDKVIQTVTSLGLIHIPYTIDFSGIQINKLEVG